MSLLTVVGVKARAARRGLVSRRWSAGWQRMRRGDVGVEFEL